MSALFLHCRPGFENECAAEIQAQAARRDISGYCRARPASAFVTFHPHDPDQAPELHRSLPFEQLIFTRQWFVVSGHCTSLPRENRIEPLLQALESAPGPRGSLFLETPDTNEGKQLSRLCRSLQRPFEKALGLTPVADEDAVRIHVCLASETDAYAGYALTGNSAQWTMGIPRLRLPKAAPSRATLKLEEALLRFVDHNGSMQPGSHAVDLGAAPGGWTWQLVRRHQFVSAIDNGPMDAQLMDSGQVEHIRADGFRYQPPKPVEWMVCDMVEKPIRIAQLAARWIIAGWCQQTIFNLKLPMKQRYAEVERCLGEIERLLGEAGISYRSAAKQLYHDREEITVYLAGTGHRDNQRSPH